ncbi:HBL262Cp [Eremothecium sinecaudum]|uniref:Dol-P-Glc:Glc(2)Man(9)GlcNAc(2)-PP-Dol alpha-1,2-glucosyltransferase n=1 Tax=Eremothecium sinecaudum TaxID=45286 RepID=A0A125RDU8_9SACH|nr:HBL262Cp [Eremothecium sinecaudum]AMD18640.1 HBL262Cp [Eremothecium sinecaudum]
MSVDYNSDDQEWDELKDDLDNAIQQEVLLGIIINLLCWVLLVLSGIYIAYKFNVHWVPYYFIDEVFHVHQTIKYIGGEWMSWDPKITTPPGLYLLGCFWYHVMKFMTRWNTLSIVRMVNFIGGFIVWPWVVLRPLYLFNAIGFWPITLMVFPLIFCFNFLYYTDVWSTILIVESLALAITVPFGERWSIWASSICGLISCLFRQTNIVWNAFIMVLVIERRALIHKDFNNFKINNYLKWLLHAIENFNSLVLPYLVNFMLFFVFLIYNKSLTLGDKQSHVAGFHLVQILYCLLFIAFFSFPVWLCRGFLAQYVIRMLLKPVRTLFELIMIMLVIRFFTVVHPFLLADNRHLVFYLYRKLLARNWFCKYILMSSIYHFAVYVYFEVLRPSVMFFHPILPVEIKSPAALPLQLSHISWTALIICTIATVVPSPLFEPRYYILPYIFWRIFVMVSPEPFFARPKDYNQVHNTKRLAAEFAWFLVINAGVIFIFARYTFSWPTEPFAQRIIW